MVSINIYVHNYDSVIEISSVQSFARASLQGRHVSTFSWGGQNFFFFNSTEAIEKLEYNTALYMIVKVDAIQRVIS